MSRRNDVLSRIEERGERYLEELKLVLDIKLESWYIVYIKFTSTTDAMEGRPIGTSTRIMTTIPDAWSH